jgi:hypothetical protein
MSPRSSPFVTPNFTSLDFLFNVHSFLSVLLSQQRSPNPFHQPGVSNEHKQKTKPLLKEFKENRFYPQLLFLGKFSPPLYQGKFSPPLFTRKARPFPMTNYPAVGTRFFHTFTLSTSYKKSSRWSRSRRFPHLLDEIPADFLKLPSLLILEDGVYAQGQNNKGKRANRNQGSKS